MRARLDNLLLFLRIMGSLMKTALRLRPRLMLAILGADTVAVLCRVGAVLVLSLMAMAARDEGRLTLVGQQVQLPSDATTLGFMAAAAIGMLFLVSAISQWTAVWLDRKMARWMTERQIGRVLSGMDMPIDVLASLDRDEANFNRMLTQNAIHVGMMTETALRMANPVMLFVLAWLVVVWQSPLLGLGIVLFAGFFLPVFVAQFVKTQRTARLFYAEAANAMGQDVSKMVNRLTSQKGVYTGKVETAKFAGNAPMHNFLNALDTNILANERIGLLVGIIGALFIGFVVAFNSWLAGTQQIDIAGLVAIAGSFIYLIASARNVASLLTNQVRFFPQVRNVLSFAGPTNQSRSEAPAKPLPGEMVLNAASPVPEGWGGSHLLQPGVPLIVAAPVNNSVFSAIGPIRALLTAANLEGDCILPHTRFLSDYYRFQPDRTVIDNLMGGDPELYPRVLEILAELDVAEEFLGLPEGHATLVNDTVYNRLSGTARTALRIVPLLADRSPRVLVVSVGAIRNLNPRVLVKVFALAPNSYWILTSRDANVPEAMGTHYAIYRDGLLRGFGGRAVFEADSLASGGSADTSADATTAFL